MRIQFDEETQRKIFDIISEKITLKELCTQLNLNRNTLKRWRNGKYSLPFSVFSQFEEIMPQIGKFKKEGKILNEHWGAQKGGLKSKSKISNEELRKRLEYARSKRTFSFKEIELDVTESPAALEVFGILMGDGCLSRCYLKHKKRYGHYAFITGNLHKDKEYMLLYVKPLIEKTFQVKCSVREIPKYNCLHLIIHRQSFFWWFVKNSFPIGKKGKNLKIPDHIFLLEKQKLNHLLRGLFDTDGCISARKDECYKYPHLMITSISKTLREQIKKILKEQDINACIHGKDVRIKGNKNFKKWFDLIGSKNPRNLNRYHEWLTSGRINCEKICLPKKLPHPQILNSMKNTKVTGSNIESFQGW